MLYNQHGVKSINTFDNYYFNSFKRMVVFFRHFYLSAATIFLVNPHIDKGHLQLMQSSIFGMTKRDFLFHGKNYGIYRIIDEIC